MTLPAQRGQAMIEMAIGVTIFFAASLGAVQLGLSALSAEGAQSAALVGARTASSQPIPGEPVAELLAGQSTAARSLTGAVLDMAQITSCEGGTAPRGGCGVPARCLDYADGRPQQATIQSCVPSDPSLSATASLGPSPGNLDGSQNPGCHRSSCFGVARSMAPCHVTLPPGHVVICLAYTSWPATAVDIWIRGTLRTVVPLASSAGVDALPLNVQLRLQVEALVG